MKQSKSGSLKARNLFLLSMVLGLMLFSLNAQAQISMIKGVITSTEDGLPVPGVSVLVKGTTVGTITNMDGQFNIKAKASDVLVIRFIGMETQEVKADKSVINVKLKPESIGLDEVVAIGYGAVKKKELTGAVAQVKAEQIDKMVTSDLGNALQGMVAGVNVTAGSGQPGESSSILIRGVSSIDGSNTPLYVVDGIEMEDDPRLSPNEIETIDVLKDAASCAIYGTRGAAGVILITTKQGKAGTLKVGLNASYGIQNITSGTPVMNTNEQIYADLLEMNNRYGTNYDDILLPVLRNPYFFQNNTDLNEAIYKDNAAVQDYSLNLSGGSKDITYNVTLGYYNQEGVVINSGFERFNTRINTTYTHNKWKINAGVGMSLETTRRPPGGIVTNGLKYHPTNQDLALIGDGPIYTDSDNEAQNVSWVLNSFKDTDEMDRNNSYANLNVNYNLMKGLNVNARMAVRAINDYRHRFSPFQEIYNPDGTLATDAVRDSYVQMDATQRRSTNFNYGATYRKTFNKKHNLTLYGGQSIEVYTSEAFRASKRGVTNNDIDVLDGATSNPLASSLGNNYTNKLIGIIGRVQYNYKSKYLFSGSLRRDGSSKFANANKWGTFPSASVAWNVMDENFFSNLKQTINQFKIRASYGEVGNQNFTPYSFSTGVVNGVDYIFGGTQALGSALSSFANADVKWETTIQSNIGFDMSFLNNKITFSAEYYNTDKRDMLMPIQVPGSNGSLPTTGMTTPKDPNVILNVGNMTNKGFELAAGYKAKTGKVNWNFSGTFSTNENKITQINGLGGFTLTSDQGLIPGNPNQSRVTALAEGYEAGAFFLFPTDGVINSEAKLAEYQKLDANARMGDLIYVDTNGDGEITDEDRVYSGSGLPDYEIGFNIGADYKGFDLNIQLYSAVGHEVMNGAKATAYAYNRHKDMTDQWTPSNPNSHIPSYRGKPNEHINYYGNTALWLEDGSFLRVRNITLGYTLPNRMTEKANISKCRFFLTAQNPLTFTKYTGFDPEVGGTSINSRGLDKGNYPITSLYSVGVNLNF
ncbi:SusC/RagA family TonB-linked outer membrane protein [Saccharicrinis aurantiacus]|uniref:SusC/RagA family TonB-linked outer membrane protein n=1 Tax=Saccharicrinis aurantiacus TaxID=1849719 RepID=UPI000839A1B9|nr:TonB-dependent receptor [Saccharicrinis aurantiacus]